MKKIQTPVRRKNSCSLQTEAYESQVGYWLEGQAYEITKEEANILRECAKNLHKAFCETMDEITDNQKRYAHLFVFSGNKQDDKKIFKFAAESWAKNSRKYILDRWDIAWGDSTPPKLLERNFGYTGLIAGTASVQEDYAYWLSKRPGYRNIETFGDLRATFVEAFHEAAEEFGIPANSQIAVTTQYTDKHTDQGMVWAGEMLCRWIKRAGFVPVKIEAEMLTFFEGRPVAIIDVPKKSLGKARALLGDVNIDANCEALFVTVGAKIVQKYCYPFCHFNEFAHSRALSDWRPPKARKKNVMTFMNLIVNQSGMSETLMLQPYWSLIMGHKALLPILYERNLDHPNLLPAYFDKQKLSGQKYVVKKANGCQGIESKIINEQGKTETMRGWCGQSKHSHIYQAYAEACSDESGGSKVFHLFTSNGKAAALGARAAPGAFVGGDDTQTRYTAVLVRKGPNTLTR